MSNYHEFVLFHDYYAIPMLHVNTINDAMKGLSEVDVNDER